MAAARPGRGRGAPPPKKKGGPTKGKGSPGAKGKGAPAPRGKGRPRSAATRGSAPRGAPARAPGSRRPASGPAPESRGRPRGLGGERVEGRQAVRELLLAGQRRVEEVVLSAGMDQADVLDDIIDLADELKVTIREIGRGKFDAMARTDSAQGVLAEAAPLPEHELDALLAPSDGGAPFLVALDGVTDPGNLGALLRTAECAGVTGVVLPRHRAVHVTPTVTKAAAGAVEFLPMALVGGLPAAIPRMQEAGVWVVGLDETGDAHLDDLDLAQPTCLVLGAEGQGLSRLVRQRCDAVAAIALRGRLNSLNVAAAGAVACFEVVRQRR